MISKIKFKGHVTIKQLECLEKKGVIIDIKKNFAIYGLTDNGLLVNMINKVNKDK